ncbi:transketolase family protein [candidate division WWE3 bacterium]|uniref:Transketolase family protein n=1 Tax=candidate division WWE3 bacterium TaxID=2053526 RepID=A0A955RP19_UNCKA|nr:transketolase family protein [candidate division WWE3 bacterium]
MENKKYLDDNWQNEEKLDMIPTRNGYGEGMVAAGEMNENVVALCADLTESTRTLMFKEKFPDRFIECGVSEANMVGVASGLASTGKIPFVASYAMFCPGMTWVQIRTTLCYNQQKVIIGGAHAGLSVGPDGATHQALEDIAIMRALPNMTVIVPADYHETRRAVIASLEVNSPVYLRFARENSPVFSKIDAPFEVGKSIVLRDGTDVTLIACGPMVYEALLASEILARRDISCEVINAHTIKPFDESTLLASAAKTNYVVSIEEHQIIGGLGSTVAETLGENYPVPMRRIGMNDKYGESGTADELLERYGLTAERIAQTVLSSITEERG